MQAVVDGGSVSTMGGGRRVFSILNVLSLRATLTVCRFFMKAL